MQQHFQQLQKVDVIATDCQLQRQQLRQHLEQLDELEYPGIKLQWRQLRRRIRQQLDELEYPGLKLQWRQLRRHLRQQLIVIM